MVTLSMPMVSLIDYKALLALQSWLFTVLSSSAAVNCFQWKMWILKEKWQQLDRCLALYFSSSRRLASHSQHTGHQAWDTEVLRRGFCDCGTQIRRSQVIQANYSSVTSCGHWNRRMDWMLWSPWRFSNQLCLEKSRKAPRGEGIWAESWSV